MRRAWNLLFWRPTPAEWGGSLSSAKLRNANYWLIAVLLAIAHAGSSWIGYFLLNGPQVAPVWPEAAIDLVAVLVFGPRLWPVLFLCYFGSGVERGAPWLPSLGIAFAGLLRTMVAAWLYDRILRRRIWLAAFDDLVAIPAVAAFAPIFSASLGTVSLLAGLNVPISNWATTAGMWWVSDVLGLLVLTPVLVSAARYAAMTERFLSASVRSIIQTTICLAIAAGVGYGALFLPAPPALLFSVFAAILLTIAMCGAGAGKWAALIVSTATIWATRIGTGPFTGGSLTDNLVNIDLFLAAVSISGLALGAFRASGPLLAPGAIALAGWVLSGLLFNSMNRDRAAADDTRLDRLIWAVQDQAHDRINIYENALRGQALGVELPFLDRTIGSISTRTRFEGRTDS